MRLRTLGLLALFLLSLSAPAQESNRPLLLAHYMPWFTSKPARGQWGWHWTMNHFDPGRISGGRQQAASWYMPLIGLYDSGDPDVLECQALQIKIAGFDGVALDWYGIDDYYDYKANLQNSEAFVGFVEKAGLKFAVVYEDATVKELIKGRVITEPQAVQNGQKVFLWLQDRWFSKSSYLFLDSRPVVMVFGPQYYAEEQWYSIFGVLKAQPDFYTLMHRKGPATGAFAWPTPQKGEDKSWEELDQFEERAKGWPRKIETAYPRFHDIYAEAGVHGSWGNIGDHDGETYCRTLARALKSGAKVIQVATWNDWGEGTQIEPSVEFGYRDLDETQRVRKSIDPSFPFSAKELRIPLQLFELRKKGADRSRLDQVAKLLFQGHSAEAKRVLDNL